MVQAQIELGADREEAQRLAQLSEAMVPDAALPGHAPVEPGCERALIEDLKQRLRAIDADPEPAQAYLCAKLAKQAKLN